MPERFHNRLLNALWDHLDDIEAASDWEHQFVTDLMERDEQGQTKLSAKQFDVLNRIYNRYELRT